MNIDVHISLWSHLTSCKYPEVELPDPMVVLLSFLRIPHTAFHSSCTRLLPTVHKDFLFSTFLLTLTCLLCLCLMTAYHCCSEHAFLSRWSCFQIQSEDSGLQHDFFPSSIPASEDELGQRPVQPREPSTPVSCVVLRTSLHETSPLSFMSSTFWLLLLAAAFGLWVSCH